MSFLSIELLDILFLVLIGLVLLLLFERAGDRAVLSFHVACLFLLSWVIASFVDAHDRAAFSVKAAFSDLKIDAFIVRLMLIYHLVWAEVPCRLD